MFKFISFLGELLSCYFFGRLAAGDNSSIVFFRVPLDASQLTNAARLILFAMDFSTCKDAYSCDPNKISVLGKEIVFVTVLQTSTKTNPSKRQTKDF